MNSYLDFFNIVFLTVFAMLTIALAIGFIYSMYKDLKDE